MTPVEYTDDHIRAAWAVHALTASGVIVGMLGLHSVIQGDARGAIVWLVVALVLDGVRRAEATATRHRSSYR